jgi:uncharacterized protein YhbP (UPF0306 family)
MLVQVTSTTNPEPIVSPALLIDQIKLLFKRVSLGSMSTTDDEGSPHINTAYLALSPRGYLCFISEKRAAHIRFLETRRQAAIAIWEAPSQYGTGLRGGQFWANYVDGQREVDEHAIETYFSRFPEADATGLATAMRRRDSVPSGLYALKLRRARCLFEDTFGRRNYIDCTIS